MSASFVFIESNTTGTGALFAEAARSFGCVPVLITSKPSRYTYLSEGPLIIEETDTASFKEVLARVHQLSRKFHIRGISTTSEYFTAVAAEVARSLNRPGPDPQAVVVTRNKATQYRRLRSKGVPVAAFEELRDLQQFEAALRLIGLPCVVKPLRGSGSVGVRRFDGASEARQHVHKLLLERTNERGMSVDPGAILTRYIKGIEYSVELFSGCVVGITRKHLSTEPAFIEIGHDFPAKVSASVQLEIERCARAAVDALGLCWGPVHVELRMTSQGPVIIEVNSRLAGGFIPILVREALGVDLVHAAVRLACGEKIEIAPRHRKAASIRFIVAYVGGKLTQVRGMDAAQSVKGVIEVRVYRHMGQTIEPHGDFRDRVGHVIAVGNRCELAAHRANLAQSQMELIVEPPKAVA